MSPSVPELIQALESPQERQGARAQLLALGSIAVPQLLTAFEGRSSGALRKAVLSILSELKDPRAETVFRESLQDTDEDIRAISAQGLSRLDTPDALDACIRTINDAPDPLHYDVTPSVQALATLGLRALPQVLPLLLSSDARTRQHAQRVLETVSAQAIAPVAGGKSASLDRAWTSLWQKNGSYQWDGPEAQRVEAVHLWQQWVEEKLK